jgi:hypothetical protein
MIERHCEVCNRMPSERIRFDDEEIRLCVECRPKRKFNPEQVVCDGCSARVIDPLDAWHLQPAKRLVRRVHTLCRACVDRVLVVRPVDEGDK